MTDKIAPKNIRLTLATGIDGYFNKVASVTTFDAASQMINTWRTGIVGDQDEKVDFSIAFEDGFIYSGYMKINRSEYVDFSLKATRYLRDILSDDLATQRMRNLADPSGTKRLECVTIAEKYDFGTAIVQEPDAPMLGL